MLVGLGPDEERCVRELSALIGVGVCDAPDADGAGDGMTVLVGDAADAREWSRRGARVVSIGAAGALRLPEERDELAQVLVRAGGTVRRTTGASALVVGVAGVHGGAGVTSSAVGLARRRGAVLVDAQGPGPGVWAGPWRGGAPGRRGIRWSDLAPAESLHRMDLADHLPTREGVPVLGPDARGWAHADDPRLPGVVAALRGAGDVVVDLGRWDRRCAAGVSPGGPIDVVCLMGAGDERSALCLAAATSAEPVEVAGVLVHSGRCACVSWSECANLLGAPGGVSRRVHPGRGRRGGRDLNRVWEAARSASLSGWVGSLGWER